MFVSDFIVVLIVRKNSMKHVSSSFFSSRFCSSKQTLTRLKIPSITREDEYVVMIDYDEYVVLGDYPALFL
uniref:Uncharacterized protein n=1 Tax=Onchocerca volvulus TaxID=6282 RepID=A0A8R1TUK3_ONCVO